MAFEETPIRSRRFSLPPVAYAAFAAVAAVLLWMAFGQPFSPEIGLSWSNKDFANYWIASGLVLDGKVADLFGDHATYFAHMTRAFGVDYPWHNWSYPPHFLFTILPLGLLGYKVSLALYLLSTFLLFCAAVHLVSNKAKTIQLLLLVPAVVANVMTAQNGFLTTALLLAALATRSDRPVISGICIGLMTVKPQLGYLLPLLLLFERRWTVIAVASITTAVLVALSILCFGMKSWEGYFNNVVPYQMAVMRELTGIFQHMMPSVYGSFRSLGLPAGMALSVHMPVAAAALLVFCFSLFRLKAAWARAASLIFATFVMTPYSVVYDMAALAAIVALWPLEATQPGRKAQRILFVLTATMPLLTVVLGLSGVPVTPFVILAAWLLMLHGEGAFTRRHPIPAKA